MTTFPVPSKIALLLFSLAVSFGLVACVPVSSSQGGKPTSRYMADLGTTPQNSSLNPLTSSAFWDGDGISGTPSIRINLAEQKAYFYKGDQIVGMSPISSGIATRRTPKGKFRITQKNKNHFSSLYGVIKDNATGKVINDDADTRKHRAKAGQTFHRAPMPYFMRFNGGIGMHTGHLPGYAASHGCIRLPDHMAKTFFENAKVGTPVIVE